MCGFVPLPRSPTPGALIARRSGFGWRRCDSLPHRQVTNVLPYGRKGKLVQTIGCHPQCLAGPCALDGPSDQPKAMNILLALEATFFGPLGDRIEIPCCGCFAPFGAHPVPGLGAMAVCLGKLGNTGRSCFCRAAVRSDRRAGGRQVLFKHTRPLFSWSDLHGDLIFTAYIERMNASPLYYKGYSPSGQRQRLHRPSWFRCDGGSAPLIVEPKRFFIPMPHDLPH